MSDFIRGSEVIQSLNIMATPETNQYFDLTPEEAEPYLPVFGDLYWWDAPVLEAAPALVQTSVVEAGMFGKLLLKNFKVHNGGVQSLEDATASYERATLSADDVDLEQGQVLQTIYEALKRDGSYDRSQIPGLFRARETESGFEVLNKCNTGSAVYEHRTRWFVVAQAERRKQGFFELNVDHSKSFSSLVENGMRPVLKIRDSKQYGSSHLIGGETIHSLRNEQESLERIRRMRVFPLIQIGRQNTYIDEDPSNFRPV